MLSARYVTSGPARGEHHRGGADDGKQGQGGRAHVSFEWVPAELVDVCVTERGKWAVDDIARHAEGLKEDEERMFGGL